MIFVKYVLLDRMIGEKHRLHRERETVREGGSGRGRMGRGVERVGVGSEATVEFSHE